MSDNSEKIFTNVPEKTRIKYADYDEKELGELISSLLVLHAEFLNCTVREDVEAMLRALVLLEEFYGGR